MEETPAGQSSGSEFPQTSPKAVSSYLPVREPMVPRNALLPSLGSLRAPKPALAPREEPRRAIPSRVTRIRHKPPTPHLRRVPSIYSVSPLPALLTGSLHAPWPRADTGPLRGKNMQQQFSPTAGLSSSNNLSSFSPSVRQGPSPALPARPRNHQKSILITTK